MSGSQVILLQSFEKKNRNNRNFKQRHSNIFDSPKLETNKQQEHKVMLENYKSNLINLGLVGKPFIFDYFPGMSKISESDLWITKLGVMLLEKIGIKQDEEEATGNPINPMNAINSALNKLDQKEKEIRQELEKETQKAKRVIESEIRKFRR